jgi:dTDP-4-dehydrorhamnose 3,5-epimerase
MHFQWPPSREAKLVRCVSGSAQDFLLDLRPQSATFLQHVSVILSADNADAVFIPSGFGHGFQTLTDETVVQYHMTDEFRPDLAGGFRWSDPAFSIQLPLPVSVISARDAEYPLFDRESYESRYKDCLAGGA